MKKAEQILKESYGSTDLCYPFEKTVVLNAIKQAQIEAIEETVKACAEAAQKPYIENGMTNLAFRSKQLILAVEQQLKSKL